MTITTAVEMMLTTRRRVRRRISVKQVLELKMESELATQNQTVTLISNEVSPDVTSLSQRRKSFKI